MSQFIAPPGIVLGSDGIATAPGFNVTAGTYDRYVDPAGSNSNDGLTALTPWQTINYALSKMPLLAGGLINIHLKAGATFSENLLIPSVFGKSGDATFGVNAIKFIGDSTNYPIIVGNPVVQNATIKSVNNPTTIYLEGVEVRSSGAAGSTGISMLNSTLIMQDSKVNTCFSGVVLTNCYFSSNAGSVGNTIAATQTALQLAGAVSIFAKNLSLSVTSATGAGLVTNNSIIVCFGAMVLTITGTNSKYGMRFLNSGILQQNSGGSVTITGFTAAGGAGAELNGTANWDISGPVTFDNVTQSTISVLDNGVINDRTGAVFTFLNGSPAVIGPIDPGGVVKGAFTGATFSFAATQYRYGYDNRYPLTYQNQNLKTSVKVWTGQAVVAGGAGVAQFFPTSDNTAAGTALFTNIYAVQATAENNTAVPTAVPLASLKLIAANKKTVDINVVTGAVLVALGATMLVAADGTNVHLTIIGD